jgi:hypothetical protein
MKGKIVNFEVLHVSEQERRNHIIQQLQSAKDQGFNIVYGLLLMDGFLYRNPETFPVDIEVKLIAGMCEHPDHLYFNYYHSIVYNSFKHTQLPSWNNNSNSFLFLGGVPSRMNRIKLLGKFYDKQMLANSIWTFFSPWVDSDKEWCRNVMSHYTDEQYLKFLEDCNHRVDDIYEESKNYSRTSREEWDKQDMYNQPWVKDLACIDPKVFADTVLSVVSEGNAYDPATNYKFLTEKTWRAIAMRHPFIFAGYPDQFNYIKSFGLRTFEEYMLIKDYAFIQNEEDRLDAVVVNTKYFLENYKQHKEEIQRDIDHNYNVFMSLAEQEQLFLKNLAVSNSEKSYWFEQTGFSHLLKIQK